MPRYEYKVVPAPTKGTKAKGVKTPQGRFANSIEGSLNMLAAEGWEYLRAELLPSEERSGLTGSVTNWRNVLIFRRALDEPEAEAVEEVPVVAPVAMPAPELKGPALAASATELEAVPDDPAPVETPTKEEEAPEDTTVDEDGEDDDDLSKTASIPGPGAVRMLKDDGVEEVSEVAGMTTALKTLASARGEEEAEAGDEAKPVFKRTPPSSS